MASLLPCSSCGRHVRITDAACPFCAAAQPEGRTPVDALRPRAKRAITFVAASMAVAACSNTPDPQVTPEASSTVTANVGGDTKPTATATTSTTATATATTTSAPTSTASATTTPSAAPSASAVASASAKPSATTTTVPTKPPAPATRYGLPPFLSDDELV